MTNGAADDSGRGSAEGPPRASASDAPPESGVRTGDVLAGKYRVERVIGSGGMGVVVAARHIQLDELVALKLLLPRTIQHPDAIGRFMQEARAAVRIKDEHVARVSDVGQLENGAPYMVMEYLEGEDLGAWLVRHGPLPVEQAAEFIIQTCVAVADAHALGIVHRDLKPADLFCVRRSDGQLSIKVLDFGISKVVQGTSFMHRGATTETGMILGSPTYMSPEQMQGGRVDYQTDVWALGVVLYELLSGRPPFQATTMPGLAIKVVSEAPPSLRALRPGVPRGLEAAIERCLAKDQTDRFPSVASLSMALRPFAPARAGELVERASGILSGRGAPLRRPRYCRTRRHRPRCPLPQCFQRLASQSRAVRRREWLWLPPCWARSCSAEWRRSLSWAVARPARLRPAQPQPARRRRARRRPVRLPPARRRSVRLPPARRWSPSAEEPSRWATVTNRSVWQRSPSTRPRSLSATTARA